MKRFSLCLFIVLVLLAPSFLWAATSQQTITMNLPEAVIAEAINRIVPLSIDDSSADLKGTITIVKISNFRLKDQLIRSHVDLMGTDLELVTRVADQNIRLKIGTARIDFDCDAHIRFDRTRQTLYIRPVAKSVESSSAQNKGDIGQALLHLLNGREFPVAMQDLKPIIVEASNKIITIRTHIVDVRVVDGAIRINLDPQITSTPRKSTVTEKNLQN